jgi:hypothetical protein
MSKRSIKGESSSTAHKKRHASTPPLDDSGNVDRNNNEMQQKRQNNVIFSRYKGKMTIICQKSLLAFSRLNNSGLCAKFSAKSTSCDAFLAFWQPFSFFLLRDRITMGMRWQHHPLSLCIGASPNVELDTL